MIRQVGLSVEEPKGRVVGIEVEDREGWGRHSEGIPKKNRTGNLSCAGFRYQIRRGGGCPPARVALTCRDMPALSDIEIQRGLGALPGWSRKGDTLVKAYHFATFPAGIAFIARVAEIAETMQHHPDVDVRYTKVSFSLTTHDAGGITPADFALASAIEELAAS